MAKKKRTITNHDNIELAEGMSQQLDELREGIKGQRKFKHENRAVVISFVIMLVAYLYSVSLFVIVPETQISLAQWLNLSAQRFSNFISYVGGHNGAAFTITIVRYTAIAISGAALAVAGILFQGSFRNIIASPSTMGVQSGATLGNALYIFFFVKLFEQSQFIHTDLDAYHELNFFQKNQQQLMAIAGSFVAIAIVVAITSAIGKGKFTSANILFSGMIFSSFAGCITTILQYYFMYHDQDDSRWQALSYLNIGNFDKIVTLDHLATISAFILPCLVAVILISPRLNVLVMGDDEAKTMGMNVKFYRNTIIVVGTLIAAVVFAFAGQIGFVGFIIPQICRRFIGPNFKKLVPMCIFLGAAFLIIVYDIALLTGQVASINIITSAIGCAMMLFSFIKGKGGRVYEE